jgi:erythronate-4-phosphate dehydrogenase
MFLRSYSDLVKKQEKIMKIIADENIPLINEFFDSIAEVVALPGRTMSAQEVQSADALIVRSVTPVNADLLAGSKVKFVGTCTIGVDHLDETWLKESQIAYASAPGCNANAVVEYVYAALCHLNVNWLDKKFGIVGCGNVGGLLYQRLKMQGVDCYCYDPFMSKDQNADLSSLDEVLACDIISLHTPLTETGPHPTFHLIHFSELKKLKTGAVLLNCGRGAVINNSDLLAFLNDRNDVRVVLDVWEPEPAISLALLDKVALGSPHIAGYSYDGKLNGIEMIYNAFCHHFQYEATLSLAHLVPPLQNNQLSLRKNITLFEQIQQLIAQVYSIADDDKCLRELAEKTRAGELNFSKGFDDLRKHYPVRREFYNYQVKLSLEETETIGQWLRILGFQIH